MSHEASLKFTMEVGALRRGWMRRQVRQYAAETGMDCEITEERGLLDSYFEFELLGTAQQVMRAQHDLDEWKATLS